MKHWLSLALLLLSLAASPAAALPAFSPEEMKAVEDIYNRYIREQVHPNW